MVDFRILGACKERDIVSLIATAQEDAEPSAARFVDEFLGNGKIERFDEDPATSMPLSAE